MNKIIFEFCRRGMAAGSLGPLVLALLYPILQRQGVLETLTVQQVSTGILSLWALAFVSGGMNVVYKIERLPLMAAILIHGGVLYGSYLATYLVNSWLAWGTVPLVAFTVIFVLGYLAIWAVIYTAIRRRTARLNRLLQEKQQAAAK